MTDAIRAVQAHTRTVQGVGSPTWTAPPHDIEHLTWPGLLDFYLEHNSEHPQVRCVRLRAR